MLKRFLLILLLSLVTGFAQEDGRIVPTITIDRDNTNLIIKNFAPSIESAKTRANNKQCSEEINLDVVYGPVEGFVQTTVEDTIVLSRVVIAETPRSENAGEQTRLQFYNARHTFNRPGCFESTEEIEDNIRIEQGRSVIFGKRLFLEADALNLF